MDDPLIGEIEIDKIPAAHLLSLHQRAGDASHNFFVSIVFNNRLIGSGTLIDAWGTLGILTAYHVASLLDKDPLGHVCLPISEVARRFEIPRECVEHILLGKPAQDGQWPDLSLLKLTGSHVIATLRSKKSFYRVADKSFDQYHAMGLGKLFWWIVGAPEENSRPMTSTADEGALMASHLIAMAGFREIRTKGRFDCLRLAVIAGKWPYPTCYGGASGGAVWTAALLLDRPGADLSTAEFTSCQLAGVLFYQGDVNNLDHSTELLANGPRTLEVLLNEFKPAR